MVLSATASAKDMQTLRRISYLARQDRTEAGEVTFVQGRVPRSLDRNDERPPYRVGDRVILGDFIRTGFGDTLEILLDINARLLIGPDSLVMLRDQSKKTHKRDELTIEQTETRVELVEGDLRVRVKENILTPTPVVVFVGQAALGLPRSDAVIKYDADLGRASVFLHWGRAFAMSRTRVEAMEETAGFAPLKIAADEADDTGVLLTMLDNRVKAGEIGIPTTIPKPQTHRVMSEMEFSVDSRRLDGQGGEEIWTEPLRAP